MGQNDQGPFRLFVWVEAGDNILRSMIPLQPRKGAAPGFLEEEGDEADADKGVG